MNELTEIQKKLLVFVEGHVRAKGYPPSWQDICDEFGWASTGAASYHVGRLKAAGLLDGAYRGFRTLHLTERGYRALAANP